MGINEKTGKIEFTRFTFYLSMFVIVASAILTTGSTMQRLNETERRVQILEKKVDALAEIKAEVKYISKTLDEVKAELHR